MALTHVIITMLFRLSGNVRVNLCVFPLVYSLLSVTDPSVPCLVLNARFVIFIMVMESENTTMTMIKLKQVHGG